MDNNIIAKVKINKVNSEEDLNEIFNLAGTL